MAVPLLAMLGKALPYITTAWSLYAQSKDKPKKKDYLREGGMYQRYITHLKSKTAESRAYQQSIRPALRQIGAQTRKGQRQVGYQVARDKPGGGIEAQMRMGINQQALEAIGIASEKASFAQEQENVRTGEQLMRIGIQEEQALQRYASDKRRFSQSMTRNVIYAGINLADITARQHIADTRTKIGAAKDAKAARDTLVEQYETAKAEGYIEQDASLESYVSDVETAGYEKPKVYNKYLANIEAQAEKDVKFQKDIALEETKLQSADELIRIKQYADEHPEDALAFIRESKTLQRTLTTKDYIKAGEYAAGKATELHPYENEFTEAVIRDNFKDMKNISDKIYESEATNKVKLATHQTIQTTKALKIAELERELRKADKAETERLKAEIKGLKFDAEKDTLSLLLGVESELHPTYQEGKAEIGENAIRTAQTTLKGLSFNKKTGAGMGKAVNLGLKKDIIKWAKAIEFDDAQITIMFSNMSELTADIPALEKYINTSTTSEMDSRSLSLIKYYLGRIDALYKQIPYDDVPDLIQGTLVE